MSARLFRLLVIATGASLAAIIVIGVLAAVGQALYGTVNLWKGLLIGIPAWWA
jgi:hypothetical protein